MISFGFFVSALALAGALCGVVAGWMSGFRSAVENHGPTFTEGRFRLDSRLPVFFLAEFLGKGTLWSFGLGLSGSVAFVEVGLLAVLIGGPASWMFF